MGGLVMAQINTFVDAHKADPKVQLIGVSNEIAADAKYVKYNFYLDNATKIAQEKYNLEYGFATDNRSVGEENFMVYVVKDKKIIDQWLINPGFYNAFHDGIAYSYDADKLQNLATKFPLSYELERISYKNEKEFNKAKTKLYQEVSALLIIDPVFGFEGSFDLSFPKNEQFTSPEAIAEFLKPQLEKLTKNKFDISYAITERNFTDRNQITMTVSGDLALHKKLQLDKVTKGEWQAEVFEALVYRKK